MPQIDRGDSMADGGKVIIKIDGDDSGFRKTLSGLTSAAKTAVKGLTLVSGAITAAWSAVGLTSVKYNAQIEQLEMSFATMTGSAEKAADIMARLKKLGAETPFETTDLVATTQMLMQYGFAADDAIDRMSMLGDISQGNKQALSSIAQGYAQMASAGKVNLQDIRQMINGGFNPLQEISERTGESMASLYDRISKGTMAVDEITESMRYATSEGGKFYQAMEKQSQTVNGMLSTIKDEARELGGVIFEPLSESIRSTILPQAREIIASLKEGFQTGGIDGMVATLTAQIPRLTKAGVDVAGRMFGGITKRLPTLMRSLLSTIPDLLRSAGNIAPQIGEALFEMMASGVEILIGQLPQLIPALGAGIVQMVSGAMVGITKVIDGVFDGIRTALQNLGLIGFTAEEAMSQVLSDYDQEHVEQIKAKINVTPEVSVDQPDLELKSLYEEIETTLTDGLEDTTDIIDTLKGKVTEYYNTQIEQVNAWREEALTNLDNTLPQAEYDAAVADINAKADEMVSGLKEASDATIRFIDTNAGLATESVRQNTSMLDGIYNTAVEYSGKIAELTGQALNNLEQQRVLVAGGKVTDEGMIINSVATTAQQYADAVQQAEETKQAALDKAIEDSKSGAVDYAEAEAAAMEEYAQATDAALATYQADMAALFEGIAQALSPQTVSMIEQLAQLEQLQQVFGSLRAMIVDAANNAEVTSGEISAEDFISNALEEMQISDADYTAIAKQLGIDEIDPAKIQQALVDKLSEAAKYESAGMGTSIFGDMLSGLAGADINEQITQIFKDINLDSGPIADMIQAAMDAGLLDGIKDIDLSTEEGRIQLIMGQFGDKSASSIGQGMTEYDFSGDAASTAANLESDVRTALNSHSPAQTMVPVGKDVSAGVGQGMGEYDFSGDAATMANSVRTAASTRLQVAGRLSGAYFSQGIALGIQSGRSRVIAAAIAVAQAAANAVRSVLKIHSPSGVGMELGGYFGQGFEMGITSSLRSAVESTNRMLGGMNLTPSLTAPDITGAFDVAAQSWADAESTRPIYLMARGKVIAQTLAGDHARAANAYNRSIALGVGK